MLFFTDPRITAWARSLGTMTYIFRMQYISMDRDQAIAQIRKSWHGSEVAEISDEIFVVRNREVLEPFEFRCITPREAEQRVQIILIEADPPFANVSLLTNSQTTNYILRCSPDKLNKQEKQLCKALKKEGEIPEGRLTDK